MTKIIDIESYEDRLLDKIASVLQNKYDCLFYEPSLHLSSDNRISDLKGMMEKTKAEFIVASNLAYVPQAYNEIVHSYRKRIPGLVLPHFENDILVVYVHLKDDDTVEHRYIHKELRDYDGYLYEIDEDEIEKIPEMIDKARKIGIF